MESQPQNPEFRNNPEDFHPSHGIPNLANHSYLPVAGIKIIHIF